MAIMVSLLLILSCLYVSLAFPLSDEDASNNYHYMRYDEIRQWLTSLPQQADFIQFQDFGQTYEGRNLMLIKISTNKSNPIIFLDAGIHAREWIGPSTAIYFINSIIQQSKINQKLFDNFQFYIVPLLNPDGYEYAHTNDRMWRKNRSPGANKNCIGVDLNRNFDFHWGESGVSLDPCADTFHGLRANSELETRSLIQLMKTIANNVVLYVTLHSYGQYILTTYGYAKNEYPPNYHKAMELSKLVSDNQMRLFGRKYQIGTSADALYEAAGGSDDFMTGYFNVPFSFTIELPDIKGGGEYGFELPPSQIPIVGNEFYQAMQDFGSGLLQIMQ